MTVKLLRLPSVMERTGLTRSKIYELLAVKAFPHPAKLSGRINAWPDDEIQAWIQARIDGIPGPKIDAMDERKKALMTVRRAEAALDRAKRNLESLGD